MSNQNQETNEMTNENRNRLLTFYLRLYNQTHDRIDLLYTLLDEIRDYINILGGLNLINDVTNSTLRQPTNNQNQNQNRNRERINRTNRQNQSYHRQERPQQQQQQQQQQQTQTQTNYRTTFQPYIFEFDYYIPNTTASNYLRNFNSSVPIVASTEQIEYATHQYLFSEICEPLNLHCPITLEQFTNDSQVTQLLGCNHIFNSNSISSWFRSNVICPLCRADIRDYIASDSSYNHHEETKEETKLEETKEELPRQSRNTSNNDLYTNLLTQLTETMIGQLMNPNNDSSNRVYMNSSTHDLSNNKYIFRGYNSR